jgi:hypothetical protein
MTKLFSDLPTHIQEKICYAVLGKEMRELSIAAWDKLDYLTPREMFDYWLQYEGILGYTEQILSTHDLLFSTKEK